MNRKIRFAAILMITVAVLTGGYFIYATLDSTTAEKIKSTVPAEKEEDPGVPVVLTPVSMRQFENRLVVQGNVEAKNVAMVPSRVAATIEAIFVDEGDPVVKGKTKLFQIDSLKLQKAVEISEQALKVARCGLAEKKANLERVAADLYKARIDYDRFNALVKDGIVSSDAFERAESYYRQAEAAHKHAKTLVDLAQEQLEQARAALEMAKKDLCDALVYAPISGKISQRLQEPGEMGDPGKPVLRIEDPSIVEVSAFLPAQCYPQIHPGKTRMDIRIDGTELNQQTISYKAPTIDPVLRTFEIKCVIEHPPEDIAPGAMAEIRVLLEERRGLGVLGHAIQQRGGRSVVFQIKDLRAHAVEVATGLESDGWVELTGNTLQENALVVTQGQFLLEEGRRVTVQED